MTAEEKAGQLVDGRELCDCPHVAKEDCDGCRLKVVIAAAIREAEAAAVTKERERCAKVAEESSPFTAERPRYAIAAAIRALE